MFLTIEWLPFWQNYRESGQFHSDFEWRTKFGQKFSFQILNFQPEFSALITSDFKGRLESIVIVRIFLSEFHLAGT